MILLDSRESHRILEMDARHPGFQYRFMTVLQGIVEYGKREAVEYMLNHVLHTLSVEEIRCLRPIDCLLYAHKVTPLTESVMTDNGEGNNADPDIHDPENGSDDEQGESQLYLYFHDYTQEQQQQPATTTAITSTTTARQEANDDHLMMNSVLHEAIMMLLCTPGVNALARDVYGQSTYFKARSLSLSGSRKGHFIADMIRTCYLSCKSFVRDPHDRHSMMVDSTSTCTTSATASSSVIASVFKEENNDDPDRFTLSNSRSSNSSGNHHSSSKAPQDHTNDRGYSYYDDAQKADKEEEGRNDDHDHHSSHHDNAQYQKKKRFVEAAQIDVKRRIEEHDAQIKLMRMLAPRAEDVIVARYVHSCSYDDVVMMMDANDDNAVYHTHGDQRRNDHHHHHNNNNIHNQEKEEKHCRDKKTPHYHNEQENRVKQQQLDRVLSWCRRQPPHIRRALLFGVLFPEFDEYLRAKRWMNYRAAVCTVLDTLDNELVSTAILPYNGYTALHCAMLDKRRSPQEVAWLTRTLLRAGANPNVRSTFDGKTALDVWAITAQYHYWTAPSSAANHQYVDQILVQTHTKANLVGLVHHEIELGKADRRTRIRLLLLSTHRRSRSLIGRMLGAQLLLELVLKPHIGYGAMLGHDNEQQ